MTTLFRDELLHRRRWLFFLFFSSVILTLMNVYCAVFYFRGHRWELALVWLVLSLMQSANVYFGARNLLLNRSLLNAHRTIERAKKGLRS